MKIDILRIPRRLITFVRVLFRFSSPSPDPLRELERSSAENVKQIDTALRQASKLTGRPLEPMRRALAEYLVTAAEANIFPNTREVVALIEAGANWNREVAPRGLFFWEQFPIFEGRDPEAVLRGLSYFAEQLRIDRALLQVCALRGDRFADIRPLCIEWRMQLREADRPLSATNIVTMLNSWIQRTIAGEKLPLFWEDQEFWNSDRSWTHRP